MAIPDSPRISSRPLGLSRRSALRGLAGGSVAAVLALGAGRRAAAQEITPDVLPPLIADWATAWSRDPSLINALYAEDAVVDDVPNGVLFDSRAEILSHVEDVFAGFPDHVYAVQSGFVAGEFAAAEWTFTATYTGAYPGLADGTGQAISLRGATILELVDGAIRREAHYYDAYAFLIQLGILPAPGSVPAATPTS